MTPGILTTCASCAAPIPYTAPRCGRCHTRYCGTACQAQHWNEGGHSREICKKIKRRGGAEKYHADTKYNEAVAVAVEACAGYVPAGATCYICTEAVVRRTGEGLVWAYCACGDRDGVDSGMTGIAHVSCLVRHAEVAGEDEMLSYQDTWRLWDTCRLCGERYHGEVQCALGWACWRANLSRDPREHIRRSAMGTLAGHLSCNDRNEEALAIHFASLNTIQYHNPQLLEGCPDISYELAQGCLSLQSNIANTLSILGRHDEAIARHRMVIGERDRMFSEGNLERVVRPDGSQIGGAERVEMAQTYVKERLLSMLNMCVTLIDRQPTSADTLHDAQSLLWDNMADALRILGPNHEGMLLWRANYARSIYLDENASDEDLCRANDMADEAESISRKAFSDDHPQTRMFEELGRDSDSESTVDDAGAPAPALGPEAGEAARTPHAIAALCGQPLQL